MRSVIAAVLASVLLFGGAAWAQSGTAKAGPFTVSAEALLWWFKSSPTPVPLVSDGLLDDVDSPAQVLLGGRGTAREELGNSLLGAEVNGTWTVTGGPGGYFALPSNIGEHTRTVFGVVPEIGLDVGYQITPWVSVFLGYSFLYASDVVRPGNQINRTINTTQNVAWVGEPILQPEGPAEASFKFESSDFWAHGLNVVLGFRF
jgi:hypothetical protein